MEIIAYQKHIKTTPRKMRLVADVICNMHPTKALINLQFMHKRAARILKKILNQAVKNAINNNKLEEKNLKIKHIYVEEAPRSKRFRAASRGRARMILKRTSHVKIILENKEKLQPTLKENKEVITKK